MALGSEGGGIQDLLLVPFILIFSILIYWSQGPQIHAPCCSTSMPALYHGGGMMLSEDGKMEERMREMAHAGCTGTGKAGTQQGLRCSCKYQDMLLFASQTAAIIWCRIHLVLQASVGSKGCLLLGTRSLLCKATSISGEILWYESQRWIQKRIQRARSLQI